MKYVSLFDQDTLFYHNVAFKLVIISHNFAHETPVFSTEAPYLISELEGRQNCLQEGMNLSILHKMRTKSFIKMMMANGYENF